MRQITNIALLVSVLLSTVSCRHSYKIDGDIDIYGFEDEMLGLVAHENGVFSVIDSCRVRHGHFKMEGRIDSTVFCVLSHGYESLMPLMLGPGNIKVLISPSQLEAKGTRLNNQLYDFLEKKNELDNRFEDLLQRSQQMAFLDPSLDCDDSLRVVVDEAENYMFDFIKRHYDDQLGVSVFLMMCYGLPTPNPSPLIQRVVDDAPDRFLNNYKVKAYLGAIGLR